jgi:hypothetical protein
MSASYKRALAAVARSECTQSPFTFRGDGANVNISHNGEKTN